jgi:hypothetical protein
VCLVINQVPSLRICSDHRHRRLNRYSTSSAATMRLGLWSQSRPLAHQTIAIEELYNKSASQFSSKNETNETPRKTERKKRGMESPSLIPIGRYDVPESTKRSSKKQAEASKNITMTAYPIIDRIPTAIGYLSDGSDEEWLEEKSRCSRYNISEQQFSADEFDNDDDEENRDDVMEEIEDESADKYSQKSEAKDKKKRKKNTTRKKTRASAQPDTISHLWSQSNDSDVEVDKWRSSHEDPEPSYVDYGENLSYAEEKGADPIYDASPKNRTKKGTHGKAASPNSPAGISDTSSVSDNLKSMLHYATTSDQVVKEIEEKLKLLKTVAAEEQAFAKLNTKESKKKKKKSKRSSKAQSSDDAMAEATLATLKLGDERAPVSEATEDPAGNETSKANLTKSNAKSNDEIELSRSISLVESSKSVSQRAMYTKSLLTEDSDNDPTEQSVLSGSIQVSNIVTDTNANKKTITSSGSNLRDDAESRKHRIGLLLSHTWNFGLRTRSNVCNQKESTKKQRGFFWNKRENREAVQLESKEASTRVNDSDNGAKLRSGSNSPKSKQVQVQELDEYSRSTKETNHHEPDLVQCLRFFQCGSMANHVNVAISVANCGATKQNDYDIDDMDDIVQSNGAMAATSPKPTVEVFLKEGTSPSTQPKSVQETAFSCGNSMSCQRDVPEEDDLLTEAPGLPLSRVPSIVIDVSDMLLHLDGDSEADRQAFSMRGGDDIGSSRTRSDLSITSINVRMSSSKQSPPEDNSNKEHELELKDYVTTTKKRKGIRGLYSKFMKKK